ncbi:MAG TPA: lanthionine synthetase C family protein [Polyangia bacterium]|jgi:hypothetical protein|nr:lanthionine synthetase C family protein [Polyangia bacterium]
MDQSNAPASGATTWRPLLTGAAAKRSEEALAAIAEALGTPDPDDATAPTGLAGGDSGMAVLFTYLGQAYPGRGYEDQAVAYLERAFANVTREVRPPGLFVGYSGVGWAAQHLRGRLLDPDEDSAQEVDEALALALASGPWPEYDLVHGLVGAGVYAIERLPVPAAMKCLDLVLQQLADLAVRDGAGLTWWSTSRRFGRRVDRYHDLGLAHGVAGVVSLLGEICRSAPAQTAARARGLLEGAATWLLQQRLHPRGAGFPAVLEPGFAPTMARSAWCYGDPAVGLALLSAGRAVGSSLWQEEGLATLRTAAARSKAAAQVEDAGLCHGATGLGHIFNRAYHASGDEGLGDAARAWFLWALEQRRPGEGLGGFRTWAPISDGGEFVWSDDRTLLTGATGIVLGLLAATTTISPDWDRMLCLFSR